MNDGTPASQFVEIEIVKALLVTDPHRRLEPERLLAGMHLTGMVTTPKEGGEPWIVIPKQGLRGLSRKAWFDAWSEVRVEMKKLEGGDYFDPNEY